MIWRARRKLFDNNTPLRFCWVLRRCHRIVGGRTSAKSASTWRHVGVEAGCAVARLACHGKSLSRGGIPSGSATRMALSRQQQPRIHRARVQALSKDQTSMWQWPMLVVLLPRPVLDSCHIVYKIYRIIRQLDKAYSLRRALQTPSTD